jgi:cyclophilin family peptidyl-prolyl cis-trans isomerase
LRTRLRRAPKLGREVITPFQVNALAAPDGTRSTAAGQHQHKPRLEAWRLPVIGLVVLAGLAGGGVAYASRCEDWGLPACSGDSQAADNARAQGDISPTAPGGFAGTPTVGAPPTVTTTATASPTPTTPTPPPTKHVPGTLRFPRAEIVLDPDKDYVAVVTTTRGEFIIDLDVEAAYQTANSFAFLGLKGFYDGMTFERQETSVEHGDPKGDGTGTAGYLQKVELTGVGNKKGTVGMLRLQSDLSTVSSQWYINLEDNSQFDLARIRGNPRPVFGTIVKGLEVAAKLTEKDAVERIEIEEK